MSSAKKLLAKLVLVDEETGQRFRKLGADAYVEIKKYHDPLSKDTEGHPVNDNEAIKFFALVLSKSLVNEEGLREDDSDTGRALLEELPLTVLQDLGQRALKWSGLAKEVAEEPPKN
jgi:hypothetical protein